MLLQFNLTYLIIFDKNKAKFCSRLLAHFIFVYCCCKMWWTVALHKSSNREMCISISTKALQVISCYALLIAVRYNKWFSFLICFSTPFTFVYVFKICFHPYLSSSHYCQLITLISSSLQSQLQHNERLQGIIFFNICKFKSWFFLLSIFPT